MSEGLFNRMARLSRTQDLVTALDEAAQRAGMPVDQQLRFRSFLDQMSGAQARRLPLPEPPRVAGGRG